ncbi:DUF1883 domain-containing protein [Sporosarcina sp. FSL W7-1283]|uniref:DUF1883 domain-containing protein n=1 Tax=Sporosarcina sp. FSL W7-1283 TaxID=2921560 RepID=UPI0030FB6776
MSRIPYAQSNGQLSVEVELQYASDVFLVDETNYRKYQTGQRFRYFGGHYTQSPVRISVSGIGRYYLIVQGGGRYSYRFY